MSNASALIAVRDALDTLNAHTDADPRLGKVTRRLSKIGNSLESAIGADDLDSDDESEVVKSLQRVEEIAKDESLPESTRTTARKAALALQREELAKSNPAAAAQWQETWGDAHGLDC
jgi:hypothetical protein